MTAQADITMILRNLKFALNSAWQSFWRNLAVSLAAVLSITLILILAGINLLVGHAFAQVLDGFRTKVSEISINVSDDTPLQTVYDFQAQLVADPRVVTVTFVTKDEALREFKSDPQNAILATQIEGNPLDAKLDVRVKNLNDVAAIDAMGRQWSGVDPTDPTNYQGDFVNRMLDLSEWLAVAGVALLIVLMIVSVVILMNTVRTAVYHRRKEIEVMKLVGATEWFVRGPFVIEGIMTGLVAAAIALALLVISYEPVVARFKSDVGFIPLSYDPAFISSLATDLLLAAALRALIAQTQAAIDDLNMKIRFGEAAQIRLEAHLSVREELLNQRLRYIDSHGSVNYVQLALTSNNINQLMNRIVGAQQVAASDQRLLSNLDDERRQVAIAANELDLKHSQVVVLLQQQQATEADLEKNVATQKAAAAAELKLQAQIAADYAQVTKERAAIDAQVA